MVDPLVVEPISLVRLVGTRSIQGMPWFADPWYCLWRLYQWFQRVHTKYESRFSWQLWLLTQLQGQGKNMPATIGTGLLKVEKWKSQKVIVEC